jgi:SAM-dependent methyltransferase
VDYPRSTLIDASQYGDTYKNKVCPRCFSLPRQRIAAYYFRENRDSLPVEKTLLFAAEYSIEKYFSAIGVRYTTADLFERDADIKVDIQNTRFADNSWSLVICNHILEHVPDYRKALKELYRILMPSGNGGGGILEITVPTDRTLQTTYEDAAVVTERERREKFGQVDHLRIFGNDFEQTLVETGFSVEVVDGNRLPANIGAETGPMKYDDNRVYICRKRRCSPPQ